MKSNISMTNQSFEFLHGSSEFLNLVLNNINSCVMILDKEMKIRAFNDSLKTIFSNKKDEDLLYVRCGEGIGCAYQIEEQKDCGSTAHCNTCDLRVSGIYSYMNNEPVYKEHITRPFFNYENKKEDKHLQFSTRLFKHKKETYIILIIEDISKFVELKQRLNHN